MPEYTDDFDLIKLLAGEGLSTDNYRFGTENIDRIAKLLRLGAETHRHNGAASAGTGSDIDLGNRALSLTHGTDAGGIPAGVRVYYKFALVVDGFESDLSDEVTVDTDAPLDQPAAPTLATASTGGVVLPGSYYYALSAWTGTNTQETRAQNSAYVQVPAGTGTNKVTITLPTLPAGATGFNVYRKQPGGVRYDFLTAIDMTVPVATFVDDGSIDEDCNRTLPAQNFTNTQNHVDVNLTGDALTAGVSWRLYRTYVQDDYTSSRIAELDSATTTFDDTGLTGTASPPISGLVVASPSKIVLTDGAEVQGLLPASMVDGAVGAPGTVLVAASDASAGWADVADFVCDGINDEVQLIAAAAALPADGGVIQLSPGTFAVDARPGDLWSKAGTTLRGVQRATWLEINYNVPASTFESLTAPDAVFAPSEHGAMEGIGVYVNSGTPVANYALLYVLASGFTLRDDCYLDEGGYGGVAFYAFAAGNQDINIIDSRLEGSTAISVTKQQDLVVMGSTVKCYVDGIGLRLRDAAGVSYSTTGGSQARIIGNRFGGDGLHLSSEVQFAGTMGGAIITDNHFQFPKQAAIKLVTDENIVSNNRLIGGGSGFTEYGIWLVGGDNNIVTGNEIHRIGKHAIFVDDSNDNLIHDNEIVAAGQLTTNTYSGVFLTSASANSVQGNHIRKGSLTNKPLYGIRIDTSTCENNRVSDNDIRDASNAVGDEFSDVGTNTRGWELIEVDQRIGTLTASSSGVRRRRLGRDCVLGKTLVDVNTAPTDASVLVDVHKNGTTIFTTQASRAAVLTGTFAATSAAPDVKSGLAADYLTVDIDQIGSTVAGADLVVQQQIMDL